MSGAAAMNAAASGIRPLAPHDWQAFRALRLAAIAESPLAIWPIHAEEAGRSADEIRARIAHTPHGAVLGAFDGPDLVGIAGVRREALVQVAHKAQLWGVFVQPAARRHGLGRALVQAACTHARAGGALQVHLGVHAGNVRAVALYAGLGFVEYGREPRTLRVGATFHDELLMVLRLDDTAAPGTESRPALE
jgi:ribosomal protein S18 acetylase RimI-like enzyme